MLGLYGSDPQVPVGMLCVSRPHRIALTRSCVKLARQAAGFVRQRLRQGSTPAEVWRRLLADPAGMVGLQRLMDDSMLLTISPVVAVLGSLVDEDLEVFEAMSDCHVLDQGSLSHVGLPLRLAHAGHAHPLHLTRPDAPWTCESCLALYAGSADSCYRSIRDPKHSICLACVWGQRVKQQSCRAVTTENAYIGARVVRGRDSAENSGQAVPQDWPAGHVGTLSGFVQANGDKVGSANCARGFGEVTWDDSLPISTHSLGLNGVFSLDFADSECASAPLPVSVQWLGLAILRVLVLGLAASTRSLETTERVRAVLLRLLREGSPATRHRILGLMLKASASDVVSQALLSPVCTDALFGLVQRADDLTADILVLRLLARLLPATSDRVETVIERLFELGCTASSQTGAQTMRFFELVDLVRRLHLAGPAWAEYINKAVAAQLHGVPGPSLDAGSPATNRLLVALAVVDAGRSQLGWCRMGMQVKHAAESGTIVSMAPSQRLACVRLAPSRVESLSVDLLQPVAAASAVIPEEQLPRALRDWEECARLTSFAIQMPATHAALGRKHVQQSLMCALLRLWTSDGLARALEDGQQELLVHLLQAAVRPSALYPYPPASLEDFFVQLLHRPPLQPGSPQHEALASGIFATDHVVPAADLSSDEAAAAKDAAASASSVSAPSEATPRFMTWNPEACTTGVVIDDVTPTRVRRDRSSNRAYVFGTVAMSSGVHRWQIRIDRENRGDEARGTIKCPFSLLT